MKEQEEWEVMGTVWKAVDAWVGGWVGRCVGEWTGFIVVILLSENSGQISRPE